MNKRQVKNGIISIAFVFSAFITAKPIFAFTVPASGSCINPPQNVYNFQNPGTHYVAGTTDSYPGTDSVFALDGNGQDTLSSSSVMQCLCPENGKGVQTNWWKATDLSEFDMKTLEAQGW